MTLELHRETAAETAWPRAWPAAVEEVLARTRLQAFAAPVTVAQKGVRVVRQGAGPTGLHLLLSGWAARSCMAGGEPAVLDLLTPGDFFGMDGEAGGADYSVVALGEVRVLTVPRARWPELFNSDPEFRQVYVKALTEQAARARRRLLALNARSPTAKLCGVILDLHARACAVAERPEASPFVPLTRSLAAAAVGLASEHVVRLSGHLRRAGVLDWGRDGLRVLAPDRLRELAMDRHGGPTKVDA